MSERTEYAPGTPSWIDVATPDTAQAAEFYGALFGWTAHMIDDPNAGGYGMFTLRDKYVAGLGPVMNPDMPPFWSVYISVVDADQTLATSVAKGGTTVMGPMDIFESGRMAVIKDPVGSFVAIWQPKEHLGAQLVNETGTFVWSELGTTDMAAAKAFYMSVFGWGLEPGSSGDDAAVFTVAGNVVCGAHKAGEGEFPAWSIWFTVDDCDASAQRVTDLGGSILMPPNDMSFGRGAVVADPQGAVFGIGSMAGDAQTIVG